MPSSSDVDPDPVPAAREPLDVRAAAGYTVAVLALAAMGLVNQPFLRPDDPWSLGVSLPLMLVAAASTLWRRRAPAVTLAVGTPLAVAELLGGGQMSAYVLLFEALWCPVVHGRLRLAHLTTLAAAAVGGVLILAAGLLVRDLEALLGVAVVLSMVVLVPLLWGWEVRHHREARATAESLASLEHELAAERAALAVESERRRIAHDLHDVIAGHLSAVSLHTSLAADLPDAASRERSLRTARDSSRAALRDLRSMIGVLTAEEGAAPTATLSWGSLGERLRGGLPGAEVRIDPALDAAAGDTGVEPAAQAALLRIGAEAVTNAVRHGVAPASLTVTLDGDDLLLALDNAIPPGAPPPRADGVGRGAITARASAVGGEARSAPDPSAPARWSVRARLPATGRIPA
ncbi:sensor histidine kinase [Brachybacterium squillarum]|uniref:sensor histidine kinase n=1 Tax=Brachybacterium squillarum TaxID=661979 RepID=UPI0022231749|nr:histidine kinase [Brachybacterium squillarum]MCW1804379.1 histidine kinase [Brachybacterium squillarum]